MDVVTLGAVLLAIVSGASEELGGRLWSGVTALVRHPFRHQKDAGGSTSGQAELAAFQRAPSDQRLAKALAIALLARADTDPAFQAALRDWWAQATPVVNAVTGGTYHAPVLQAHTIQATFAGASGPVMPIVLVQLPPLTPGFTGRDSELAAMATLLDPARDAEPVVVSAVAGLPGVGKTTLAVHAAHAAQQSGWFPGGILFLNLHGYDPASVGPGQALDTMLRALGVLAAEIPRTVEERATLYRSTLAQIPQPVLVIADNAAAEAQVRPLLPGSGPHRVLVTSRHTLAGLGARLLDVTVLEPDDSADLLDRALRNARPGDTRIISDPGAAARLAAACGGLPLALQITAAVLIADLGRSAADLAEDLSAEHQRLERLRYDDGSGPAAPSVAAAFELSYRRLDPDCARMFRLLSVHPGADVSSDAAAILTGQSLAESRQALAQLAKAHLIESASGALGRWRMHDLLRLYARRLSDDDAGTDNRDDALDQLLSYYLTLAEAATKHMWAFPGDRGTTFTGRVAALGWYDANCAALIAAVRLAGETRRDHIAMNLPLYLSEYLQLRYRLDDLVAVTTISLNTARAIGDRHGEGMALNDFGAALHGVGRIDEGITALQEAAAIFRETGDRHREATALMNFSHALREVRRFDEATTAAKNSAAIFEETGDRNGQGKALQAFASVLNDVGRQEEAITTIRDALAMYRETSDRHSEGYALYRLGFFLQGMERFDEGITALRDAAAILQETGDRYAEGCGVPEVRLACELQR